MPCYLLHMIEAPNRRQYADLDVRDVVGEFPRLFCARSTPPEELTPSDGVRCLQCDAPCWQATTEPPSPLANEDD